MTQVLDLGPVDQVVLPPRGHGIRVAVVWKLVATDPPPFKLFHSPSFAPPLQS